MATEFALMLIVVPMDDNTDSRLILRTVGVCQWWLIELLKSMSVTGKVQIGFLRKREALWQPTTSR